MADWPDLITGQLIAHIQDNPVLFDLQNARYHDRDVKHSAYERIATALDKDVAYVKTRIASLRTQYSKVRRLNTAPKSGSAAPSKKKMENVKRMREMLSFLEPHMQKRPSVTNLAERPQSAAEEAGDVSTVEDDRQLEPDTETPRSPPAIYAEDSGDSEDEGAPSPVPSPISSKKPTGMKRKARGTRASFHEKQIALFDVLKEAIEKDNRGGINEELHDSVSTYLQHAATRLRGLDPKVQKITMNEMDQVLFRAEMGLWTAPSFSLPTQSHVGHTPLFSYVTPGDTSVAIHEATLQTEQ